MNDGHEHGVRRYYLVEQAIGLDRGIDDYNFVNEVEALPSKQPYRLEDWGSRTIPGMLEETVSYIGLPRLRATPRFILGKGKTTTIDAYVSTNLTIVSDRLKRLMRQLDADAFEFAEVEATHGETGPLELGPYWAYAVVRGLDCIDDERSDVVYYSQLAGFPEPWLPAAGVLANQRRYAKVNMARMFPEIVGDAAAFVLQRREGFVVFDERIVDTYRAQKMKGFTFSPLQEPVGRERKPPWSLWIRNHNYWHDRGVI